MSLLGITETPMQVDNLIAGTFPRKEVGVTLIAGQNLKRGAVLGKITASGKYTMYNPITGNDGSEVAAGILGIDTDATNGDTSTMIYVTGEFHESEIIGLDSNAKSALFELNCYVM